MSAVRNRPPIIPPRPENVPDAMRRLQRWAPWRAVWDEKKQKYTKIPHRANKPEHGLSNKGPSGWVTFDEAMAAYAANLNGPPVYNREGLRIEFAGVGYLMTGPHGVTGVDLDHCRDPKTGEIAPWALEIMAHLDSYTEVSPSGTGLHIMAEGSVPEDWANHDQGIEVYGGNVPRFLCITGERIQGTEKQLRPLRTDMLDYAAQRYRKAKTLAQVEDLHLPDLLPVEFLPELAEIDLPPHARNFLTEGPGPGDRSRQLINAATALAETGLPPDEVLSILEANEHAMEVALDHRQQDYDKALRFLWKHSAVAGARRADSFKQLSLDDFDDIEPPESDMGIPISDNPLDDFEVLPDEDNRHADLAPVKPTKRPKYAPESAAQFLQHVAPSWIIKGVLPRAGLAVIYGASSSGKTFFTLDLVAAVARGVEWRGLKVKKGRVIYVVAEGAGGFRNRLEAYCRAHDVDPADFDILFLRQAPNLMTKDDIKEFLLEIARHGKFDLIVIDTYARAMAGGNENDAKDVGQAVAHCDVIYRKTGAMVMLVHHSGKDATKGARGSGALRAAADLEIEVVQTRGFRAATITKQKDGADGVEYAFKLAEVPVGMDEDDEVISSCVVEHLDTPMPKEQNGLKGHAATTYATLTTMLELDPDLNYATAIDACAAQLPHDPTKRDRRRDLIVQAFQSLENKGLVRTEGGRVYLQ